MKVPVEVLVTVCIAVGLLPGLTVGPLVDLAARAVFGADLPAVLGRALAWVHPPAAAERAGVRRRRAPLLGPATAVQSPPARPFAVERAAAVPRLRSPASRASRSALHPVRQWGAVPLSRAALRGRGALVGSRCSPAACTTGERPFLPLTPLGVVAALVLAAAALGCVIWHRKRLVALVFSGVVGLVVSIAFLYFSAPDLAMTQLVVEVVTTVLVLMALARLPAIRP